ncbi:hypothetical protein HUZ36_12765 [Pseudoalteromonas sp. McH1-7]|uniref:hypothetical protein n=2 Tax=Pseudoalteromonas TaxID=53246 RepID=UPI0015928127|nr:hypothetical protein [Pseudoalteromonas sp. McH1-7]NUZ11651.1 hypothetical protein [Pseudoalteromonas sp. McH1-7]
MNSKKEDSNTEIIIKLRKKAITMNQVSSIQSNHKGIQLGVIEDEIANKIIRRDISIEAIKTLFPLQNGILVGKGVALNTAQRNTKQWHHINQEIMRLINSSTQQTCTVLGANATGEYKLICGYEKLFKWVFNKGRLAPCEVYVVENNISH